MKSFIENYKSQHHKSGFPFEDFLKEIHGEDYHGTDDDMSDDFDDWITNLQIDDVIGYGNQAINMALGITNNK